MLLDDLRVECSTNPLPQSAKIPVKEIKTRLLPTPFQVRLYDLPSLFAGKMHALLFRDWKSRVKGRDFYDFVWYVSRNVPVNLPHLEARMSHSGNRQAEKPDLAALQTLLKNRIERIDISAAAEEVRPFFRNTRELGLWSKDLFVDLSSTLKTLEPKHKNNPKTL